MHKIGRNCARNYVVRVTGKIEKRPDGTENTKLATGAIELHVKNVEIPINLRPRLSR